MANLIGKYPALVSQYYIDEETQEVMSKRVKANLKVPDTVPTVQLEGEVSQARRFKILVPLGMIETKGEITEPNEYKVNYEAGFIYFHPSLCGTFVSIDYYTIGGTYLSCDRIFTDLDIDGNVSALLGDVLRTSKMALEIIKLQGNVVECMEQLEEDIANAKEIIPQIQASGGSSIKIEKTEWLGTAGKYYYVWNHNLGTINYSIDFTEVDIDGNLRNADLSCVKNDGNTVTIYAQAKEEVFVYINAKAYIGSQLDVDSAINDTLAKLTKFRGKNYNIEPNDWVYDNELKQYKKTIMHNQGTYDYNIDFTQYEGEVLKGAIFEYSKDSTNAITVYSDKRAKVRVYISIDKNIVSDNISPFINEGCIDLDSLVDTPNKVIMTRAERDCLFENALSKNIKVEKSRDVDSETSYWITTVPSNSGKLQVGVSEYYETHFGNHDDDGTGTNYANSEKLETATDFAKRKNAKFVINGGIWDGKGFIGIVIANGVVKSTRTTGYYSLGFREDNSFVFYPPRTSSETIVNDGIKNCISGFVPVVINGQAPSKNITDLYVGGNTIPSPRQCIGIKADGTIVVLTCEGRKRDQKGMLLSDLTRIMIELGVKDAYNLDGGGSAETVVNGVLQNNAIDSYHRYQRKIANYIYIKEEIENDNFYSMAYEVEKLKRELDKVRNEMYFLQDLNKGYACLRGNEGFTQQGFESWDGDNKNTKLVLNKEYLRYWDYQNSKNLFQVDNKGNISTSNGTLAEFYQTLSNAGDLNNINLKTGIYWTLGTDPHSCGTGALLQFRASSIAITQFFISWHENIPNQRRSLENGRWSEWSNVDNAFEYKSLSNDLKILKYSDKYGDIIGRVGIPLSSKINKKQLAGLPTNFMIINRSCNITNLDTNSTANVYGNGTSNAPVTIEVINNGNQTPDRTAWVDFRLFGYFTDK